jgi:16S rRNA processing protein RimM
MPAEPAPVTVPARDLVCVAAVAAAHGVRGALKLKSFTAEPESVAAYGPLFDGQGRRLFEIRLLGQAGGALIAQAQGIATRDAAEALRGQRLYVPRSRLPAVEEDEFYHADLLGLDVVDGEGRPLGKVRAIHDFGAGDLLDILGADGASLVVPFTREVVPMVDIAARRVTVLPPPEVLAGDQA